MTEGQAATKKFHRKFAFRKKEVRMRKYFLTTYGKRDPQVRKTIKYDLRYFKDAAVDTLVLLSRGHLFYEKMITMRANPKTLRFHGTRAVEECWQQVTADAPATTYSVTIHSTDGVPQTLLAEKKRRRLLERGTTTPMQIVSVPRT
ncbi:MAG: hypothetical protein H6765_07435 [Candidatus Peribacteria bacterium]|nr:MAG: hypothetical protein H6765_07435 [Candidatus Peribacteria bacterium]